MYTHPVPGPPVRLLHIELCCVIDDEDLPSYGRRLRRGFGRGRLGLCAGHPAAGTSSSKKRLFMKKGRRVQENDDSLLCFSFFRQKKKILPVMTFFLGVVAETSGDPCRGDEVPRV